MSTPDPTRSIEQNRGALERLVLRIPGFRGYRERELRREADQMLREWGCHKLDTLIRDVHEATREADLEAKGRLGELADRVTGLQHALRHADRGYAGFFDEVKSDSDAALEAAYGFDADLVERIDQIHSAATESPFDVDALERAVAAISATLKDREQTLRGL